LGVVDRRVEAPLALVGEDDGFGHGDAAADAEAEDGGVAGGDGDASGVE
jgi:hypothetical protein